jgi:hypothetical protein
VPAKEAMKEFTKGKRLKSLTLYRTSRPSRFDDLFLAESLSPCALINAAPKKPVKSGLDEFIKQAQKLDPTLGLKQKSLHHTPFEIT